MSSDLPDCPAPNSAWREPEEEPSCTTVEACASALASYSCGESCGGMDRDAQAISAGFQRLGERSVPVLVEALQNGDDESQALAAFCLLELKQRAREATPALVVAYHRDVPWALNALCFAGDRRAIPALLDATIRDAEGNGGMAGEGLVRLGALTPLADVLRRPGIDKRTAARVAHLLVGAKDQAASVIPSLHRIVADATASNLGRATAAGLLPRLASSPTDSVQVLLAASATADASLRESFELALVGLGEAGATQRLMARVRAYDFKRDNPARCGRIEDFVTCNFDMLGAESFFHAGANKDAGLELAWLFWKSGTASRRDVALQIAGASQRAEAADLILAALSSRDWNLVYRGCNAAGELGPKAAVLRDTLRGLARSHWSDFVQRAAQAALSSIAGAPHQRPASFEWPRHLPERCRAQGLLPAVEWSHQWWLPKCDNRIRIPADLPSSAHLAGLSAAMRLRGGWLVGTDRGEWGGELSWQGEDGRRLLLSNLNVVAIESAVGQILALQGLAHMSLDEGQISRLVQGDDGTLRLEPWVILPGAPECVLQATETELVVAAGGMVVSIDREGRISALPCARPCAGK